MNCFGDFAGSFDADIMGVTVRAPLFSSVIDHSLSTLCLSSLEHVHQMQAYLELAASMPHAMERNFQSAPKLKFTVYCTPFTSSPCSLMSSTSFMMSARIMDRLA